MNNFITQEGKTKVLQIAFGGTDSSNDNKFGKLALGERGTNLASITGKAEDFQEISHTSYERISADSVTTNSDGSITMTFTVLEDNYNDENSVDINEIALLDNNGTAFAYCEVPIIAKNKNVSLKYTLKISID